MKSNTQKRVIFIMSEAHSGSTLLDLLLGSHSQAMSMGELVKLKRQSQSLANEHSRPCLVCDETCPYWNDKADLDAIRRRYAHQPLLARIRSAYIRYRRSIYHDLFEWFDFPIIVDSSKNVPWIKYQLRHAHQWRDVKPYLLYLVRDARAVVNSLNRKFPEKGIHKHAQEWRDKTLAMNAYYEMSAIAKFKVRYEILASEPEATMTEICRWLGMPFELEMLEYWRHDHHIVGGNTGTRSLIHRYQQRFAEQAEDVAPSIVHERHQGYYQRVGEAIFLDLRWQGELSEEQVRQINEITGDINIPFEYPAS